LLTVSLEMVGLMTFFYGIVGFIVWLVNDIIDVRNKNYSFINNLPLLLLLSPLLFLWVVFYAGGPGVKFPSITLDSLINKDFSLFNEVNIRYGIQALPFAVIFTALLASKSRVLYTFIAFVCMLQVATYFTKDINLIFSLPARYAYAFPLEKSTYQKTQEWLGQNYDGGLVMLSVNANDPAAFYFPIPYKNYIFEGTDKFWKTSIKNPTKHAEWIIMQNVPKPKFIGGAGSTDLVAYYLMDTDALRNNYSLMHKDDYFLIYKRNQ
jgi:hypothetical protein